MSKLPVSLHWLQGLLGYMVVFVLLPLAYALFLRRSGSVSVLRWLPIGGLLGLNLLVLLVGGAAWGEFVFGVGWLLVGLGVPLYYLNRTLWKPSLAEKPL